MADIQLKDAMFSLRPNRSYAIRGGVLEWHDTDVSAPAQSEIDAEILKLKAEYDGLEYSRTRANEYLPIGDQLDMQYKDLINGTTTWKDHIAKVKSDNPKG
mgnify:CR=1 FL=1